MALSHVETSPWCAVGSADKDYRGIVEGRKKKPRRVGGGAAPAGLLYFSAGRLPADLKRGVLSEDAVYDLITDHTALMARMQKAVLKSIEKKEF